MAIQITCINKDAGNHYNPHEAIERFGWYNPSTGKRGFASMGEMVNFLEQGNKAYVISRDRVTVAYLYVRERNGRKFVQTIADGKFSDNLLQLDEC